MRFDSCGGSKYTVKPGTHPATIMHLIGIGLQENNYEGELSVKRQIIAVWKTNQKNEDGESLCVWSWLTLSLHEKSTLVKVIKAVSTNQIDKAALDKIREAGCINHLVGRSGLIGVEHTAGGNAKVVSYSNLIEGVSVPVVEDSEKLYFDYEEWLDNGAVAVPELPKHYLKQIAKAKDCPKEIQENISVIVAAQTDEKVSFEPQPGLDDDIPF